MPFLPRLIAKLPVSREARLAWHRSWLDQAYARDIAAARKAKDKEKIESLERDRRYELDMHDEEEDGYLTRVLLLKARRLRVPIPHRHNPDNTESEHWYQGHYTGGWYLTARGFGALREEIRRELKARHEARTYWIIWLSAMTGVIGAVTGLVALLGHRP